MARGRDQAKPKRRLSGTVDRIEGGMVVVLVEDPREPDVFREVYVPRSKFTRQDLEPGDRVTVWMD